MKGEGVAAPVRWPRSPWYWLDVAFSRLIPACIFSFFLVAKLLAVAASLPSAGRPSDYLDTLNQALSLAYFAMLVVLYAVRLPRRGSDRRLLVILVSFVGTFSILFASLLPRVPPRAGLSLFADLLITAGLAWSVWGLAYLRRSFSILPEARRLVTGGPYRLSRHPIYLGEVLAALGVTLPTAGWAGFAVVLLFLCCQYLRIAWEEQVLARTFSEYPAYSRRVPRYLPDPRRLLR
ncbi:MAG TPA: isoprenylcysteine carboxylmethyltransferase family protein [Candidatus Acidoferrales bacterium]|nr:isoprenylcysteine carboxylmethyltransferase family protein [Candidatus Acidoferrales bacterium]